MTRIAARNVLIERDAGRAVDPSRIEWAEDFLRGNPTPKVVPPAETEEERARLP
jgi:hypothetical protein